MARVSVGDQAGPPGQLHAAMIPSKEGSSAHATLAGGSIIRVRVAYLHGAEQRDETQSRLDLQAGLERGWLAARLPGSFRDLEVSAVYYGDLFSTSGPRLRVRGISSARTPGSSAFEEVVCPCCRKGSGYQIFQGVHRAVGTPLRLARFIIDVANGDARRYVEEEGTRRSVQQRVIEHLHQLKPDAVIAHSLGTVVLVDVLAQLDARELPRLIVTAGSPLGREGLFDVPTSWREAELVTPWLNLIDPTDEVTGARRLGAPQFPAVINCEVDNDHYSTWWGPDGGFFATHSIRHYLRHPVTAWTLAQLAAGTDGAGLLQEIRRFDLPSAGAAD